MGEGRDGAHAHGLWVTLIVLGKPAGELVGEPGYYNGNSELTCLLWRALTAHSCLQGVWGSGDDVSGLGAVAKLPANVAQLLMRAVSDEHHPR